MVVVVGERETQDVKEPPKKVGVGMRVVNGDMVEASVPRAEGVGEEDTLPPPPPPLLPVARSEGRREGVKVCVAEPVGVKNSVPCADALPPLLKL